MELYQVACDKIIQLEKTNGESPDKLTLPEMRAFVAQTDQKDNSSDAYLEALMKDLNTRGDGSLWFK
jgi:hypothetical protein